MILLLEGALVMASLVSGLFFLRFWTSTRDRLFLFFALAFWVFALHWAAVGVLNLPAETRYYLYVPRLVAFSLIIAGVVHKNREGP